MKSVCGEGEERLRCTSQLCEEKRKSVVQVYSYGSTHMKRDESPYLHLRVRREEGEDSVGRDLFTIGEVDFRQARQPFGDQREGGVGQHLAPSEVE